MKKILYLFYRKIIPNRLKPIVKKMLFNSRVLSKLFLNKKNNGFDKNDRYYSFILANELIKKISAYETISFDIFDTLITRKISSPNYLFDYVDEKVSKFFKLNKNYFKKARLKAENLCRTDKHDCSINDIYDAMAKITNLNRQTLNKIKDIEIRSDMDLIIPRYDMLYVFNKLKSMNKHIILVSDMYYTNDIIEKILVKNGYIGYNNLYVSCEINARKDTGELWKLISETHRGKFIHIGDNFYSDMKQLKRFRKKCILIPSPNKKYATSFFFNQCLDDLDNALLIGLIENYKLANSPFGKNNKSDLPLTFNLSDYGYCALGPLFLYYCVWLHSIKKNKTILFVSREGHYLQKIYNHIFKISKLNEINDNKYLLISRRAITVANITSPADIRNILKTDYTGTIGECMHYRFGIDISNQEKIILPKDLRYVEKSCKNKFNEIIKNAKNEKTEYIDYLKSLRIKKYENTIIADLGYSGTAQYELSKLLKTKISGAYFVVSDNVKPLKIGGKVYSCFNNINNKSSDFRILGPNSQYLEAFLTSPDGQLVRFLNHKPVYLKEYKKSELIKKINKIYLGIINFINDYSKLINKNIYDIKIDNQFVINNYASFANHFNTHIMPKEFLDTFKFENFYSFNYEYLISKRK